ncbi:MAG: hypothetical protein A2Z57_06430 [Planctomycetes bacterium RIFCSPHIGHO2_12_39_6]|nr:MAG: hypothetical protein A2Z57_06430 [Planctomycetes bacterium RIFCSPHIGHO2_12_39_6]
MSEIPRAEERLARIETKLDSALSWLSKRDDECNGLEKRIVNLQIEQGKQGVVIYLFTGIIASVLSIIVSTVFAYLKKG